MVAVGLASIFDRRTCTGKREDIQGSSIGGVVNGVYASLSVSEPPQQSSHRHYIVESTAYLVGS